MNRFIPDPSDPAKLSRRILARRAFRLKKGSIATRRKFRARCPWNWSTWPQERESILDLYHQCAQKSWDEGRLYHVDHAIPLNGKLCSGLHVVGNLQIVLAEVNLEKGNDYNPE